MPVPGSRRFADSADEVGQAHMAASLSVFFGMVAALLAGAGLFRVLAYSVAQRGVLRGVGFFVLVGMGAGIAAALSFRPHEVLEARIPVSCFHFPTTEPARNRCVVSSAFLEWGNWVGDYSYSGRLNAVPNDLRRHLRVDRLVDTQAASFDAVCAGRKDEALEITSIQERSPDKTVLVQIG
jgi:hypothetical protein